MSLRDKFITAEAAAAELEISRPTLYAYVSRGLIQTSGTGDDPRRRLYSVHDVDELKKRKAVGRRPREVAATTLDWGLPVLSSAITLIENGGLYYRGRNALHLADTGSLEEVARLLWDCGEHEPFSEAKASPATFDAELLAKTKNLPLTERCQSLLPFVAVGRATAWKRSPQRLWPGACALLRTVAGASVSRQPDSRPIDAFLADAWGLNDKGRDIVRRALVLLADHELNASAFAVRVVASTGASLGACLNAGLSALSGPMHGGTTSLVELLFDEVERVGDAATVIESRLRRGDSVPGFDHPLYPDGDPRARGLLPHLPENAAQADLMAAMSDMDGKLPNCDFALVAVRRALGLPQGSALALFAISRTAGWIAHALEQVLDDKLIRPRARYTGPAIG
jgi:citrate synthase